MLVATVGHVDHGKTALVRALTGVDTDRLPEEKARGLSIDLGFAYRRARDGSIVGFVDVPGHERFVHNMVAGVSGIDHALVVVAADDGPMPQTMEHLAILDLLGISSATAVLTKIDRVEPARLAEVEAEVRGLIGETGIARAAAYPVCALSGAGVESLWAHLENLERAGAPPRPRGGFRLAVDRCFTLDGVGLVVTGTVTAGTVAVGDKVVVSPSGVQARVRSLRAQDREAQIGQAGERCALNLRGSDIRRETIARGDWIVAGDSPLSTARIDVELVMLPRAATLRAGARVHVHLGAKEVTGRLVPLSDSSLEPGRGDLVQIVLDEPIGALWGDRLVVRDWAARNTVGGGAVLDPFPPARGRARPDRLAALRVLKTVDASEALRGLLELQPNGVDLGRFAAARNLTAQERERIFAAIDMVSVSAAGEALGFAAAHWFGMREKIVACVEEWHRLNPDSWGPSEDELRRRVAAESLREGLAARVRVLIEEGELLRKGTRLHRPGHLPVLSPQDQMLWQRVEPLLAGGGMRPPSIGHLAAGLGLTIEAVESFLKRAAQLGFVLQVADNRYFPPGAAAALASAARDLAQAHEDGLFSTAEFRDRTGIGRNLSVEVLEYFDRCGLTRRSGERRRIARRPESVFGHAEP